MNTMTTLEFNEYLSSFENILSFPAYMREINKFTFNVNPKMINDYLFMYGKVKPCMNGTKLYNYTNKIDKIAVADLSRLIRKYRLTEFTDYIIENNEYILSPQTYYLLIYAFNDNEIINQFNKVFTYETKYNEYLKMKNQ